MEPRPIRDTTPAAVELIARARAMIPALAERALAQKARREILPETIAEMRAAGLLRVLQPKRWGGYEMELGTFYDIEIALAEGDMSAGWTFGVLGAVTWFLGLIDDRVGQEVWGNDSNVLICSSTMPAGKATAVDAGFRLSGHWRYASACEHCSWALLGGMVQAQGAPPDWHFFIVPRRDYRTVDNWQVAGLQGTGSIDIILDDVFVPAHRAQRMQDNFALKGAGQAVNTSSLYRLPFGQIFVRGVSTAAIGALQAMCRRSSITAANACRAPAAGRLTIRWCSCSAPKPRRQSTKCTAPCSAIAACCTIMRAARRCRRSICGCSISSSRARWSNAARCWRRASSRQPAPPACPTNCRSAAFSPT